MSDVTNAHIGQLVVSRRSTDILVAPYLGSCLGVACYDPRLKHGAVLHALLPLSSSDPAKAKANPFMYVDTGLVELLKQLVQMGSNKGELAIYVAGCNQINDENGHFQIGKKNYTVLRKLLWKNDLLIKGEHVGGNSSTTISLELGSGAVSVQTNGQLIRF